MKATITKKISLKKIQGKWVFESRCWLIPKQQDEIPFNELKFNELKFNDDEEIDIIMHFHDDVDDDEAKKILLEAIKAHLDGLRTEMNGL